MEQSEIIRQIAENLEAIAIIDYVPDDEDTIKKMDAKFSEIFDSGISEKIRDFYPWVPVQYVNALNRFKKTHNIPRGIEDIQIISVKHIGVAQEVICYCKINKMELDEEVEKLFKENIKGSIISELLPKVKKGVDFVEAHNEVKSVVDDFFKSHEIDETGFDAHFTKLEHILDEPRIEKDPKSLFIDYLNSKLIYLDFLQIEAEKYFRDLILGIFLSGVENDPGKPSCLSAFIYNISNLKYPIVEEASKGTLDFGKVSKWIRSFDYTSRLFDEDDYYRGTNLSLLGWTLIDRGHPPFSLIGQNFVVGYGSQYKMSKLGSYKNRFIIFRLKEESECFYLDKIGYENMLIDLSKFMLPTHWIRYRLEQLVKLKMEKPESTPTITHDKEVGELSKDLKLLLRIYDTENAKTAKNIDFLTRIRDELSYLKSMKSEMVQFSGEGTDGGHKSLSDALIVDMNFWFNRIYEQIEDLQSKQDLRLQHMQNTITTTNSFIANKLQDRIKNLTTVVAILTLIIAFLTFLLAIRTLQPET